LQFHEKTFLPEENDFARQDVGNRNNWSKESEVAEKQVVSSSPLAEKVEVAQVEEKMFGPFHGHDSGTHAVVTVCSREAFTLFPHASPPLVGLFALTDANVAAVIKSTSASEEKTPT
jgi:hypothetical protein